VRFFVGVTDYDWFSYLSGQQADEVNFWQPSGNTQFRALQPGEPFRFKLHSPRNVIAGGGYFSHFSLSPLSFAWDAFQEKNGAHSLAEMRERVWKYKKGQPQSVQEEVIGCILLQQPFFFSEADWISVPDWPRSIVRGKGYDTDDQDGRRIWEQVQARLTRPIPVPDESVLVAAQKFGNPQIKLPRLGQGAFRIIVADSYHRQCALSSSHILHILDAAHIRPYTTEGGTHSPTNGILLRQDIHTLFDRGYITVTPDYRVEVSKRIKEEFNNGVEYYAMQGKQIHLPLLEQLRPSQESLAWHNENVFLDKS
jgi:putative restriction endonuclease